MCAWGKQILSRILLSSRILLKQYLVNGRLKIGTINTTAFNVTRSGHSSSCSVGAVLRVVEVVLDIAHGTAVTLDNAIEAPGGWVNTRVSECMDLD
jgi:hypothetical protein